MPDLFCLRNWYKFTKAMESDVGATKASDLQKKGCKVKPLIMDDDSTTLNRIENTV